MALAAQLEKLGKSLGEREGVHAQRLEHVRERASELYERVRLGLEGFHRGSREAGAPHLVVELSAPRIDDKRIRSVQFDLSRGCHRMIVTAKSKGEVTLVGPFKVGKQEGPCKRIPLDDDAAIDAALGEVLAEFLDTAFTG